MPQKQLLIIDDNEGVYESLELNFRRDGVACLWAPTGREAVRLAANRDVAAAVLDLSLGAESGLDVMEELLEARPGLPVVFISGFGTLEAAVAAVKLGAYDFLAKPLNYARLRDVVFEAMARAGVAGFAPAPADSAAHRIVHAGPAMAMLLENAARVAKSDLPVLITGESGTGKELLAEYVHAASLRSGRPLVRVNCSAISESLAESELFGHVKGAFTGAVADRKGFFQQADGGTIHLDEIGDMTLASQARILRVLEDARVRPLGSGEELRVDIRVVASTNKDPAAMAASGAFRTDLYYRLNAVHLHIPPLRERREDIPALAGCFLANSADGGRGRALSPGAFERLASRSWPGNVRELKNAVRVASLQAKGEVIQPDDIPGPPGRPGASTSGRLEDAELAAIRQTLADVNGNRRQAAKRLGISLRTLYYKLERYDL